MTQTIAITGASGLVGGALCRHFAAQGYRVRALVRRPEVPIGPGIETFRCDLPDALDAGALAGADIVIHAAYPTREPDLKRIKEMNEVGTRRLVDEARKALVARFILVSTTSAHEQAVSYYGRGKLHLEQSLDTARDLAIRPGLVLAPSGGLFNRIRGTINRARKIPVFDGGHQIMQTIHIGDLCAGFQRAIERSVTGVITLAEPDGLPFRDFLKAVAQRAGRRITLIPVPTAPFLLALRISEGMRIRLPVSSENLLGLRALRRVESAADLSRLGLTVRTTSQSLDALFSVP